MSNPKTTVAQAKASSPRPLADEYGNFHYPADELARGGQGVVFRTGDADLAIKQPLNTSGNPDQNANLRDRFRNIRLLPLPPRIPISLPLAILRDEPGYVMRLLSGMQPFSVFDGYGRTAGQPGPQTFPQWLAKIPDRDTALQLLHYAHTGSTRRRLFALSRCAAILARIHSAGLVYGDISHHNIFVGDPSSREVWLIDADNLRFERSEGGSAVYTPAYGAPEIVQGRDCSRPRTDCWAFAVMAFRTLSLCHPFIGKRVLEPNSDEGGWDAEPAANGAPADLDEQAYAGYLPFVDDEDDDSNAAVSACLSRELVATPGLCRLFQETFVAGRAQPHRRPAMAFWALELARACDQSIPCPNCQMSYFADNHEACPYCGTSRPAFAWAKTDRWKVLIPAAAREFALPHRMFHPFSFERHDDASYEAVMDFARKTAWPVRGTARFPDRLTFHFEEAAQ